MMKEGVFQKRHKKCKKGENHKVWIIKIKKETGMEGHTRRNGRKQDWVSDLSLHDTLCSINLHLFDNEITFWMYYFKRGFLMCNKKVFSIFSCTAWTKDFRTWFYPMFLLSFWTWEVEKDIMCFMFKVILGRVTSVGQCWSAHRLKSGEPMQESDNVTPAHDSTDMSIWKSKIRLSPGFPSNHYCLSRALISFPCRSQMGSSAC